MGASYAIEIDESELLRCRRTQQPNVVRASIKGQSTEPEFARSFWMFGRTRYWNSWLRSHDFWHPAGNMITATDEFVEYRELNRISPLSSQSKRIAKPIHYRT